MTHQPPLNFSGRELRDDGIARALDHAERTTENWTDIAGQYLVAYLEAHTGSFMTEDMREWAVSNGCPKPPSLRAWGGVIAAAARSGRIEKVGYGQVKNSKAHCANAAIWREAA